MHYYTHYIWEQGSRTTNEDSLTIMQLNIQNRPALLAIIADGIGGMLNGEDASGIVTNRLKCAFETASYNPATFRLSLLKKTFLREVSACHHDLLKYSAASGHKMGTTLCLICIIGNRGLIMHIGDSRIYSLSPYRQLTSDHTDGLRRLTKCIGYGNYQRPTIRYIHTTPGRKYLLCSDGFYRRLTDAIPSLNTSHKRNDYYDQLKYLYSLATCRGEKDNISAILIECKKRKE